MKRRGGRRSSRGRGGEEGRRRADEIGKVVVRHGWDTGRSLRDLMELYFSSGSGGKVEDGELGMEEAAVKTLATLPWPRDV